ARGLATDGLAGLHAYAVVCAGTPPPPRHRHSFLHAALPICGSAAVDNAARIATRWVWATSTLRSARARISGSRSRLMLSTASCRSEEHTSELQSRENLVCRLLLEKKNGGGRTAGAGASRGRV